MTEDNEEPPSNGRGRPIGSISLTPEIQHTIVEYIRAGGFAQVAAEAAGVAARTFYEWLQRGEDAHPSRPATPELEAFAEAVRIAQAHARLGAEVRVYRENPRWWLSHAARTKPESEGWSEPRDDLRQRGSGNTFEARLIQLDEQEREQARTALAICPPGCTCIYHKEANDEHDAITRYVREHDSD